MPIAIGDLVQGKYRILRIIGQGGMGTVFEGEHEGIARRVAIKVLHPSLGESSGTIERFEREAQAAGRIGNDHILEVLDRGQLDDGERFMVMEYLDGESLEDRIVRRGKLTTLEAYFLVRQLLIGLKAAHEAGIVHRDLKPDNIFILRSKAGNTDFVKVIDFGISKFLNMSQDLRMTATGAVMGTPYYMAPEQARGSRDADWRSDIYAVGVILYRIVSGLVPFDAASFNELLFKVVLGDTPKVCSVAPEVDAGFESLIYCAMARDPSARFQSATEMVNALDAWYATTPQGMAQAVGQGAARGAGSPLGGSPSSNQPGFQTPVANPTPYGETQFAVDRPPSKSDSFPSGGFPQDRALPEQGDAFALPVKRPFPVAVAVGIALLSVVAAGAFFLRNSGEGAAAKLDSASQQPVSGQAAAPPKQVSPETLPVAASAGPAAKEAPPNPIPEAAAVEVAVPPNVNAHRNAAARANVAPARNAPVRNTPAPHSVPAPRSDAPAKPQGGTWDY